MPATPADQPWTDTVRLVNPLCGSESERDYSTGLTYPAVGVPWGMTYFSPMNRPGGQVFTRRRDWPINRLDGFVATHAASAWVGDYGSVSVLPGVGTVQEHPADRADCYRLDTEHSAPHDYRIRLAASGIGCELTATARCGMLRLNYPADADAHLLVNLTTDVCEVHQHGDHELHGTARDGVNLPEGFACRYVVRLDRSITSIERVNGALVVRFDAGDGPVHVTLATSFIDHEQAQRNANREIGGRDFDAVRAETEAAWRAELDRVRITGGTDNQRRTFYTCLWRTLLFPRTLTEFDADDNPVHRSPYTGGVKPGHLVTDNGFWDTSRTVYPLLSLAWPTKLGETLDGWLTAYRQSGWMPQWASPGHRAAMVGTHSAAVFADAIAKGIKGFDHATAFASMLKDATVPGHPDGVYGRQQLPEYLERGYCPEVDGLDSVCRSLDYAYNDWCVAVVADVLSETEHAATFRKRAENWRTLFDPVTKFFRPRDMDGQFVEPFREFLWGGPYREGGPWQYRFAVPHDPRGLADVFGGSDALAAEMQRMVDTPPHFEVGTYRKVIHEMAEMAGANFGQYAHSNQPVHGMLFTAARVGRPDVTQRLVRRVLDELYSPDDYPGDEDNGEMGAWYVLAAIGLFPHCPGDPSYTRLPSLFDDVVLHADDGHVIHLPRVETTGTVAHADVIKATHRGV
ncbi:MAG: GH92 family glycosyl hydrolase [Planctomycetota bacterium]